MIIAFIPVRGGSKSIPLKNIRSIAGRPLIYWVLDAATAATTIDRVVVSTDSFEISDTVSKYCHPKVEIVSRSAEVSSDTASTESVMLEYANQRTDFSHMVLIQATSPLLQASDLEAGIRRIRAKEGDSLLSVVRQKRFIWEISTNGLAESQNYDFRSRPRRQNFAGYFVENGAFYVISREDLLRSKCRLSGRILLHEMPEETYFEIDEPSDWIIVEQLLKRKDASPQQERKSIKMFLSDVDGVLTDAGMYYSKDGEELKKFNTKDGAAFELLRKKGVVTGLITGENSSIVSARARKLKIEEVHLGVTDKLRVVMSLCEKYHISPDEVAYIGDDINDLEVVRTVGYGCAVADATDSVRKAAKFVCSRRGGEGAFREAVESIL